MILWIKSHKKNFGKSFQSSKTTKQLFKRPLWRPRGVQKHSNLMGEFSQNLTQWRMMWKSEMRTTKTRTMSTCVFLNPEVSSTHTHTHTLFFFQQITTTQPSKRTILKHCCNCFPEIHPHIQEQTYLGTNNNDRDTQIFNENILRKSKWRLITEKFKVDEIQSDKTFQ
jgi:hypothetical protein